MNRFSQKDILRGNISDGLSLNRYLYCENDPVNLIDPSGMELNVQKDCPEIKAVLLYLR